jgi:N-acetylglutamate synthase-like GNAT family acetyltransferase
MSKSGEKRAMGIEYTVRRATADDVDSIVGLVKQSLGEGNVPREERYWNWKHRDNPFGISPCLVAEANGQLIGVRAFMRWSWRSNGSEVRAVRAVDTATHPEWRERGIFSQLTGALVTEMQQEGVSFIYNTPNERSRPGYLKMGWTNLGRTSLWLRVVRPIANLRTRLSGRRSPLSQTALTPFPSARALLDRPECRALLGSQPSDSDRLTTRLSATYLRWRYADIPGLAYYTAWELDGAASAAVVFRLKRKGSLRELRICDMVLGPNAAAVDAGRRIIRSILETAECDFASAMATHGSAEARVLARSAFMPAPRTGPILTVRSLTVLPAHTPDPLHRSSWRLSIGALELF